jgi:hypothetical protein
MTPILRPQFRLSTLLWITLAVACWFGGWFGGMTWQKHLDNLEVEAQDGPPPPPRRLMTMQEFLKGPSASPDRSLPAKRADTRGKIEDTYDKFDGPARLDPVHEPYEP